MMRRSWPILTILGATLLFVAAVHAEPPYHFHSIDLPGTTATFAFGINSEGDIVGRYLLGSPSHGYLLSRGALTTIDAPYGLAGTTQAWGINPEGEIVGLYTDAGTVPGGDALRTRAFFRDAYGNFTRIDFPGAENTLAIKISPTGQVVGCYHHQNKDFAVSGGGTMHGYVYQNGDYQSLDVPGTMNNGISRDGRIIVGVVFPTPNEFHAYKVEDRVYSLLDVPSYAVLSDARDVNAVGDIVGYYTDSSGKNHGFLLDRAGFTTIDFPGGDVTFSRALGIDPEGDIVGTYMITDASGASHTHGFIATRRSGDRDEDSGRNEDSGGDRR